MPPISSDRPLASEIPSFMSGASGYMDDLLIGPAPALIRASLVPGSQPRGCVLGLVTSTGQYALSDPTASDGRQTPVAVLVQASSPSGLPMIATSGQFNSNYLLWSQKWETMSALSQALNAAGITCLTRGATPR